MIRIAISAAAYVVTAAKPRSVRAGSDPGLCRLRAPSAVTIEWMFRIERIAVDSNVAPIATMHEAAQTIVAGFTKRPKRAEHEGVVVAHMSRMMIGDRGRRYAPLFLAQGAERLDPQLVLGPSSPGLQIIPGTPG